MSYGITITRRMSRGICSSCGYSACRPVLRRRPGPKDAGASSSTMRSSFTQRSHTLNVIRRKRDCPTSVGGLSAGNNRENVFGVNFNAKDAGKKARYFGSWVTKKGYRGGGRCRWRRRSSDGSTSSSIHFSKLSSDGLCLDKLLLCFLIQ